MLDLEKQVADLAGDLAVYRTENQSLDRAGEELKALELLLKIRHANGKVKPPNESASALMQRLLENPK